MTLPANFCLQGNELEEGEDPTGSQLGTMEEVQEEVEEDGADFVSHGIIYGINRSEAVLRHSSRFLDSRRRIWRCRTTRKLLPFFTPMVPLAASSSILCWKIHEDSQFGGCFPKWQQNHMSRSDFLLQVTRARTQRRCGNAARNGLHLAKRLQISQYPSTLCGYVWKWGRPPMK